MKSDDFGKWEVTGLGNTSCRIWEMAGAEYGRWKAPSLGNDAGDDFGKFALEDR